MLALGSGLLPSPRAGAVGGVGGGGGGEGNGAEGFFGL